MRLGPDVWVGWIKIDVGKVFAHYGTQSCRYQKCDKNALNSFHGHFFPAGLTSSSLACAGKSELMKSTQSTSTAATIAQPMKQINQNIIVIFSMFCCGSNVVRTVRAKCCRPKAGSQRRNVETCRPSIERMESPSAKIHTFLKLSIWALPRAADGVAGTTASACGPRGRLVSMEAGSTRAALPKWT